MKWIKRILLGILSLYLFALMLDVFISKSLLKSSLYNDELKTWSVINNDILDKDILVFGSSRAMAHVNPVIFKSITNKSTYNLGYNAQNLPLIKYRIDVSESKTNAKNFILVLDDFTFRDNTIFKIDQLSPILLYNIKLYNIQKGIDYYKIYDVYIPLIRYFKNYNENNWFKELYKVFAYSKTKTFKVNGYRKLDLKWKEEKYTSQNSIIDFDENIFNLLKQIIDDCKKKNINLILVTSPTYIDFIHHQKNHDFIIDKVKKISNENNILFIDYSRMPEIMDKQYFADKLHLNSKGADIFTKKLAEDIKPYLK
ncbi:MULTISPECIES: hypothetical protein [Empedobacter]|uniref:hypothetical protein n=1 Tax=Empedobacter TaxID=59734 RepID=UPI001269E0B1|nr:MULTISPECIES: hypothetical protein [Empedobacter]MBW1617206.1 hypothetical protein [Empedobacter falsenii]MDH1883556.1 hypothetical protein [Empedobacter sp. GD03797]